VPSVLTAKTAGELVMAAGLPPQPLKSALSAENLAWMVKKFLLRILGEHHAELMEGPCSLRRQHWLLQQLAGRFGGAACRLAFPPSPGASPAILGRQEAAELVWLGRHLSTLHTCAQLALELSSRAGGLYQMVVEAGTQRRVVSWQGLAGQCVQRLASVYTDCPLTCPGTPTSCPNHPDRVLASLRTAPFDSANAATELGTLCCSLSGVWPASRLQVDSEVSVPTSSGRVFRCVVVDERAECLREELLKDRLPTVLVAVVTDYLGPGEQQAVRVLDDKGERSGVLSPLG
jgi:hypothetical protein